MRGWLTWTHEREFQEREPMTGVLSTWCSLVFALLGFASDCDCCLFVRMAGCSNTGFAVITKVTVCMLIDPCVFLAAIVCGFACILHGLSGFCFCVTVCHPWIWLRTFSKSFAVLSFFPTANPPPLSPFPNHPPTPPPCMTTNYCAELAQVYLWCGCVSVWVCIGVYVHHSCMHLPVLQVVSQMAS